MTKSDTVTLVLLGRRGSGKSCCGNTILGRKGFQSVLSTKPVTTECKKETESIQGRQITVIDTPDFFDDSLPHPKLHIDTCRSLVAEGPCVYLLVLQLGRFTEGEKKLVEQIEHVFGRDVTRRMIILFSYGDDLEGITIEDFLKNAQTELKALVKKCGNRYHVFNNRDTSNHRQVTELLNMVDDVLDRGKGGPVTQTPQLSVKNTRYVEKQEAQIRNNDSAVWRMEIEGNDSTYRAKRKAGMRKAVTLVLLGRRGSGKSCCGNTILGRKGFQSVLSTKPVTTECETQKEFIQGRQITVIDTPDFFGDSLPDPKTQIDTCRSLVAEGSCVYLLVLQLGRFTEGEKKIVEQTECVFGPDVTRRMIILFSYGDDLEGITIEDFLKNAQTELKALVKRCGNRYHVFNNRDTSNHNQVTELLNMVDVLDRGKGGPVTQTPQLSVKNTRYVEKQEAQIRNNDSAVRRMEIEVNDSTCRVKRKLGMREGDDGSLQKRDTIAVTLVLLSRRGSGKSCCGNTILGRKGFQSYLSTKPVTTECKKETESIQGRQITVIDTPDFFDDSLPHPKQHIDTCRSLVAEGPCVYLLVLQLGRFTEGEKKIVEQTEHMFGPDVTRRMIILFSYGDDLEGITIEDFLKNAQTDLKALVKKCGNRYHVFNNRDTSNHRQVTELLNMVDVMLVRGEGGTQLTDSVNGVESKAGMAEGDKDHLKMPRICVDINESNAGNIMNKMMSDITGNQEILKTQINGDYSGNAGSMKGNMVLDKRGNTDIQSRSVNVRDSRMGNDGGVPESQRENAHVNDNRHRVKKKPEMTGDYEAQGTASALGTIQGHNVRDPDRKRTNITDSANTSYVKRRAGEPRESSSEMQREDMQDCRRVGSRETFKSIGLEVNQHDVYKRKNMRGAPGDPQQAQHKQKQVTEGVVRDGRKMQAQGSPVTRGEDSSAQRDGRNDKESTTMCKCVLF